MSDLPQHANDPVPMPASAEPTPYTPPRVTRVGPVQDITLGGSPGTGDSGNFGVEEPFA